MKKELPGIAFEKLIADIQAKMDPTAEVLHNQRLTDRLGHERQFDVVFKGQFGGQPVLGVIECKDLKRKVGTPEVDAFVTKARDVNANVKVLISRRGFSDQALEKCRDYGIEPMLLVADETTGQFNIGQWFRAERRRIGRLKMDIFPCEAHEELVVNIEDVKIDGHSIIESLLTYLHYNFNDFQVGWTTLEVVFAEPRILSISESININCGKLLFYIEKTEELFERFVPWESQGFFNIKSGLANFPVGENIVSAAIPTDLEQWEKRVDESQLHEPCLGTFQYIYKPKKFDNALALGEL